MIDTGYRLSLSLFYSFSEKKKKEGWLHFSARVGVRPVGIMHAGTWEFEVSWTITKNPLFCFVCGQTISGQAYGWILLDLRAGRSHDIGNLYSSVQLGPWQDRWGITLDLIFWGLQLHRALSTAHFSNKEDDYRIEFAFRGELVVPYLLPVWYVWNQTGAFSVPASPSNT